LRYKSQAVNEQWEKNAEGDKYIKLADDVHKQNDKIKEAEVSKKKVAKPKVVVSEGYAPHDIIIIIRWQVVIVLTS
jgi:hypothetical protein